MAFDLSDEELKATRIMNGTASKEELYERIAELEEIEKDHKKENGELRERVEELESELQHKNDQLFLGDTQWGKYIDKNYIPKSKIKEKIEELEKEYEEYKDSQEWEIFDETKYAYELLQELLEERN